MKKILTLFLSVFLIFNFTAIDADATYGNEKLPYVVSFNVTTNIDTDQEYESRATGLIHIYSLSLAKTGTTLYIGGQTIAASGVVKCGFKDLMIQRRKSSSDSWADYYEYGNVYRDAIAANLETTLVVASGYQYRISCKHYAKKSLLVTQTISNTSNIVTVS